MENVYNDLPIVSILIAARNEESNIITLLDSLLLLDYPVEKLQILIGNDSSEDNTKYLVENFISNYPHIKLIDIPKSSPNETLKAKARVLSILGKSAIGEYYLYTDADIKLPKNWVKGILNGFEHENIGVVVGLTLVENKGIFSACQSLEWLSALRIMKLFSDFKIPTTGMGNNMAVSAKAYDTIGGFENVPFSIVEDYAIYKAIIDKQFEFRQLFNLDVLAYTNAPQNYFEQRKRWVTGGFQSKSNMLIPAILQSIAFPIILILCFWNPSAAISLIIISFILNFILAYSALFKLKMLKMLIYLPFYTAYMLVFWFLQIINFLIPYKITWKNRSY